MWHVQHGSYLAYVSMLHQFPADNVIYKLLALQDVALHAACNACYRQPYLRHISIPRHAHTFAHHEDLTFSLLMASTELCECSSLKGTSLVAAFIWPSSSARWSSGATSMTVGGILLCLCLLAHRGARSALSQRKSSKSAVAYAGHPAERHNAGCNKLGDRLLAHDVSHIVE